MCVFFIAKTATWMHFIYFLMFFMSKLASSSTNMVHYRSWNKCFWSQSITNGFSCCVCLIFRLLLVLLLVSILCWGFLFVFFYFWNLWLLLNEILYINTFSWLTYIVCDVWSKLFESILFHNVGKWLCIKLESSNTKMLQIIGADRKRVEVNL